MQITDTFHVDVAVETAWDVLLDVERIAPCMPGAQLQEVEGDEYRGIVKVKVGPITAQYKGAARIVEADVDARRIVIKAEGRDTRGQGNAAATVTATLTPDATGTEVGIDTDLHVTGKVAQFGRGVMTDVSSKLLAQFVECLHGKVLTGDGSAPAQGSAAGEGSAPTDTTSSFGVQASSAAPSGADLGGAGPGAESSPGSRDAGGVRKIDAPEAEAVNLGKVAGGAVAKRAVPALVVGALVIAGIVWLLVR